MSPLIATVLLIAFAVALGAMIMNWEPGGLGGCSDLQLASEQFCFDGEAIRVGILNSGDGSAMKLSIKLANGVVDIPDSALGANQRLERRVSLLAPVEVGSMASIVATIEQGGEEVTCQPQLAQALKECS